MATQLSAAKEFTRLETKRQPYLTRAWDAAELTIPFLLPRNGNLTQDLPTPYQGIGARGVNNLSAKLLLALFPANAPFFKFEIDDFTLQELTQRPDSRAKVEAGLAAMERAVATEIETKALRVPLYECLRHLIVAGNALLNITDEGTLRVFHLDQYVVQRDPQGEVITIVVKESISTELLIERFSMVPRHFDNKDDKDHDLYTVIKRKKKRWDIYQEVGDKRVPKSDGNFPLDKSPWMALRFCRIDGENYGRGFVEEYIGDLRSVEGLNKAILEGSAAAARVLFLLNPNSTMKIRTLENAPNLAIRSGNKDDVTVVQMEKFNDFRTAETTMERIEQRLSAVFLLNQSIQRDAERVTAEEIRFMASELETTLGGIYSILSLELQLPLAITFSDNLQKSGKLPKLPKGDTIKPTIVTGFEALGRDAEANKLALFLQKSTDVFGPEVMSQWMQVGNVLKSFGTGFGLDIKGIIKDEEQVQEEQQEQQRLQTAQTALEKLGPAGVKVAGDQLKAQQ